MEPQEETGGLKRTRESSSDDDDYGTPTDSPRDDSLGYYNITYIAIGSQQKQLQILTIQSRRTNIQKVYV